MAMNRMHQRVCSSAKWARQIGQALPDRLAGVELGDEVLEIGPGYGATTEVLLGMAPKLTAVEVDPALAGQLAERFAGRATVVPGDGTDLPFEAGSFTAVVCFTMLHHMPTPAAQDALFAEARRVLRPGGVFAGSDSQLSLRFRFLHIGDTMTVIDPATLPDRLATAGFTDIRVAHQPKRLVRFAARKPGQAAV